MYVSKESLDKSKLFGPFNGYYFAKAIKIQSAQGYLWFWKGAMLWLVSHISTELHKPFIQQASFVIIFKP